MTDDNQERTPKDARATGISTDAVRSMNCTHCDAQINVSGMAAFAEIECPQCGQHETVPAQFGHFRLLRLLGTGGMGGVYHAYDETLGRAVAIKVMLKSLGEDGDFVETFKREAQAVAKLNHPHIAQIYSFGQEKGQPYIVMELVDGRHMDEMIEQDRSLSEALVLRIALEISQGLSAADEIGLIHGDIKPENILLDEKGNSKLVDFGLATFASQQTQDGIWGTPYYIAPEKVRRQRVDARSDIYSLGASLFHALTGKPPFDGKTPVDVVKARLTRRAPLVSSVRKRVDADVDRIVARMLDAEPGRRYPNYASLISDLEKTLQKLGPIRNNTRTMRSRKVVIRKKGAPPPPTTSGAAPIDDAPKTSRIVITRGASTAPIDNPPRTSRIVIARGGNTVSGIPRPAATTRASSVAAHAPRKSGKDKKKGATGCLVALLLLALAGAGTIYGLSVMEKKAQETKRAEQEAKLDELRRTSAAVCEKMATDLADLAKSEAAAMSYYQSAAADVLAMEAVPLVAPQPPPEPQPEAIPATIDTNTVAAATNSPSTNVVEEAAVAAEPGPEPAAAPAGAEAEAVAVAAEPDSLIMGVGKRVVEACETIMGAHAEAGRAVTKATALNASVQESHDIAAAQSLATEITLLQEPLPELLRRVQEALARAKESSEKSAEIWGREKASRQAEREREEELARLEAERLKAEQEAAAMRAETAAEIERANLTPASVHDDVMAYRYNDAARKLELQVKEYKTEGGRAAMKAVVERYERLNSMQMFLIKRLTDKPFQWGYMDGANRVDILSANNRGIRLKDRTVLWRDISTRQMFAIIKHYISDGAISQDVMLRELANQNLNAAIFCAINGSDAAARSYAQSAVQMLPTMQGDVDRLVPLAPEAEE